MASTAPQVYYQSELSKQLEGGIIIHLDYKRQLCRLFSNGREKVLHFNRVYLNEPTVPTIHEKVNIKKQPLIH